VLSVPAPTVERAERSEYEALGVATAEQSVGLARSGGPVL
jgi:hypothetical protein